MAIPYYIGIREGYFAEQGIEPTTIVYPSGAPQVKAAVEDKTWDLGVAGVVPNIIGGAQGLLGIGICFDQSAINQLVGNALGADMWPPETLEGIAIATSPNSTGDFVVQACLQAQGYDLNDITWIYAQQNGVIESLEPGLNGTEARAVYGGLWAPNTYRFLENNEDSQVLCRGDTVYATVTGGFMVRDDFAEEKPEVVTKTMAAWLRGIEFVKDRDTNEEAIFQYMEEFYAEQGVMLSRAAMEEDMRLIKLYSLDEQIALMERKGDPPSSQLDFWTIDISEFMLKNGVVASYPAPVDYITDKFFLSIRDDPELAAFARGQDPEVIQQSDSATGMWTGHFSLYLCLVWAVVYR